MTWPEVTPLLKGGKVEVTRDRDYVFLDGAPLTPAEAKAVAEHLARAAGELDKAGVL